MSGKRDSNSRPQPWQGCALPTELFPQHEILFLLCYSRAENETRTRDPNLGKVVLYQLSYFRNKNTGERDDAITSMLVPRTGLEPARLSTYAPETYASTIPPPGHCFRLEERKTRLELATPTLARLCSTN